MQLQEKWNAYCRRVVPRQSPLPFRLLAVKLQKIRHCHCRVMESAISKHLKNIFESGELIESSVHSILEYTAADGNSYKTKFYNRDAILSVGDRVNSRNATLFRQWANKVLKEYLLRGYSVNQRLLYMESRIDRRLS